ncbi:MAG TPA: response regulator transcription factor [Anaerolineales bacterium]|nr:response regulator transcription factor [Anaerolineales bacterium]
MTAKPSVLVVDDEQPLRDFIRKNLEARGFSIHAASNGLEALAVFNTQPLDLIILDVMMPNMDGLETTRRIRQTSQVPIVILSALGEEKDKVAALDLGADDYLTKPFGVDELLARVRAVLRRTRPRLAPVTPGVLRAGGLTLDPVSHTLTRWDEPLKLTPTEFDLLHYFMQNMGKVITHRELLQRVWGAEYGDEAEYLRVYIRRLRQKIEADPLNPHYLLTEHSVGYRFG